MSAEQEEGQVEGALDFLVQAARVSQVLRAKVQIVDDEIRRLRRWKSEATTVINYWDIAYEMAHIDGRLGDSKPTLMLTEIERLRESMGLVVDAARAFETVANDEITRILEMVPDAPHPVCPSDPCAYCSAGEALQSAIADAMDRGGEMPDDVVLLHESHPDALAVHDLR